MYERLQRILKCAVVAALGIAATAASRSRMAAQVPAGFSTTPIFGEEFNGNSVDKKVWTYRHEGTVHRNCYFDSRAVTVENGHARIRIFTTNNSSGSQTNHCGGPTTETGTFLHTYGYWEASVRFQYRPGMQCGFWLQSPWNGSIINNPQQAGVEMDVFEHVQSANATSYDHAIWWNGSDPYTKGVSHIGSQSNLDDGNFHAFGLAWTPGSLTFYVDGIQTWHLSASEGAISNVMDYIILDTELPSAEGVPSAGYGLLGSSANPYMDVDYVRVYPYSTKTTSTTISPVADAYVQDGAAAATKFPNTKTLLVKSGPVGSNRNAYLKFDLSQITAPVLQATLYLTPMEMEGHKIVTVASYVPDNGWTDRDLTWNSQPAISTKLSTGTNYGVGLLTNFDITAVAAAGQQLSVQIAGETPGDTPASVEYGAEEHGIENYRPRLVVISGGQPLGSASSAIELHQQRR
jgi:hypothetical protein